MIGDHNTTKQQPASLEHDAFDADQDAAPGNDSTRRGASMVEYALLLVFVLLAAFLSLKFFGDSLVAVFDASADTIETAPNVRP